MMAEDNEQRKDEVSIMTEENSTIRKKNVFKETSLTLIYASAFALASIGLIWLLSGLLISLF
jgi:hypothetical protein